MTLEQKRQIVLAYLCGVSERYIKSIWPESKKIIKGNILNVGGLVKFNDPLIQFYSTPEHYDRKRNAIHIYLSFSKKNDSLECTELVDENRDRAVFEAVSKEIFEPKIKKVIKEVNLEKIISSPPFTAKDNFLRAICGEKETFYGLAWQKVNSLVFERLYIAYVQRECVDFNKVFKESADILFSKLKSGLLLVEDPNIIKYSKQLEKKRENNLKKMATTIINSLNESERMILKRFFRQ